MYLHPVRTGLTVAGGGILLGVAAVVILAGIFIASERPLERWYHSRNH